MEKEPGDQNTVAVILILCDLIFDEFNQDIYLSNHFKILRREYGQFNLDLDLIKI